MQPPSVFLCALIAVFATRAFAAETQPPPSTPPRDLAGSWEFRPDPSLPDVLLLGDSISLGYTRPVRAMLAAKANVFRASGPDGMKPANCGDTGRGLAGLEQWLGHRKWSVIHFN